MHEIAALEAESKFGELLDRVEAGEEVAIIRDGKTIARLVPSEVSFDREKARRAAEAIQAMSIGTRLDGLDVRDLIAEGRLLSLVLDASLTLSWYFEDERTPEGQAVLRRLVEDSAIVPPLWRLEVANGLQMAVRRKRIDAAFRDQALLHLEVLPIRVDPECQKHEWTTTVNLSDAYGLTIYDAAYVELAHRRLVPLASLDKQIRASDV